MAPGVKQVLVGIDAGTSSVKVTVVSTDGELLGQESADYPTLSPQVGWAEQDPEQWWLQTRHALGGVLEAAEQRHSGLEPIGIGVTGQMHSTAILDGDGRCLRPSIVWMDSRARELVPAIEATLRRHDLARRVRNRAAPGLTLCPLVWLRRHEPQVLDRAQAILLPKDYIRFRLTGIPMSEYTDASATLLLDVSARAWLRELEGIFDIPMRALPPLEDSWRSGGRVDARMAEELGLPGRPVVALGAADQQAASLATGVLEPNRIQMMLGTGAQVLTPSLSSELDVSATLNLFCHYRRWIVQGSVQNAGSSLEWVMRVLGARREELADAAGSVPVGGLERPLFLPYLTGERTPIMNENATGAWLNLRYGCERGHLLYAAAEGVCFAVADAVTEVMCATGGAAEELRCSGGGSRLAALVQLISDTLEMPITVLEPNGAPGAGAAILAGVACGVFSSVEEGAGPLGLKRLRTVAPDPRRHVILAQRRELFHGLRDSYLERLAGEPSAEPRRP